MIGVKLNSIKLKKQHLYLWLQKYQAAKYLENLVFGAGAYGKVPWEGNLTKYDQGIQIISIKFYKRP